MWQQGAQSRRNISDHAEVHEMKPPQMRVDPWLLSSLKWPRSARGTPHFLALFRPSGELVPAEHIGSRCPTGAFL